MMHPCCAPHRLLQALVRRKVKMAGGGGEKEELYHLRVPPAPLPVSWGRTVQPYVPAHLRGQRQMAGGCVWSWWLVATRVTGGQGWAWGCVAVTGCLQVRTRMPALACQTLSLPPSLAAAVPVPPALLRAMQEGGGDGKSSGMTVASMEACSYHEVESMAAADWGALSGSGGGHQAVLINPGWECEGRGDAAVQVCGRQHSRSAE